MDPKPPDVMVLGTTWPERALLRAQLIEEGHEVVAVDTWPIPRLYRRPGMKPRVLLIDLRELPKPRETLDEVRFVLPPERVLVVTALGSLTSQEVQNWDSTSSNVRPPLGRSSSRLKRYYPGHPRNGATQSYRRRATAIASALAANAVKSAEHVVTEQLLLTAGRQCVVVAQRT